MILDRPTLFSEGGHRELIRPRRTALITATKLLLPDVTSVELESNIEHVLNKIPARSNAGDVEADVHAAAAFLVDTVRTERRRSIRRSCIPPTTMLPKSSLHDAELPSRFL